MKSNAKAHYALLALLDLHSQHGIDVSSAAELAHRHGVSEKFMKIVLSQLAAKGLITSVRGPKGGFAFAQKTLKDINLYSVLEAVDEVPTYDDILQTKTTETTLVNDFFKNFYEAALNHFKESTLEDLVNHD